METYTRLLVAMHGSGEGGAACGRYFTHSYTILNGFLYFHRSHLLLTKCISLVFTHVQGAFSYTASSANLDYLKLKRESVSTAKHSMESKSRT